MEKDAEEFIPKLEPELNSLAPSLDVPKEPTEPNKAEVLGLKIGGDEVEPNSLGVFCVIDGVLPAGVACVPKIDPVVAPEAEF